MQSYLTLLNDYSGESLYLDKINKDVAERIIEKSKDLLQQSLHK